MKFVVVGAAGRMGSLHARHLRDLGHFVVPIDDADAEMIPSFRFPGAALDCHGVVIATPAARHIIDIRVAIDSGYPVFVEKPICLIDQVDECNGLLEKAKEHGVSVHVGYNLRFHPAVAMLKSAIVTGSFEPMFGAFVLRQRPSRPIKSFLEEWASHEVDLAQYLLGPVYQSSCDSDGRSDDIRIVLDHRKAISFVHADAYWALPRRSFTVIDTNGFPWSRDIELDHVKPDHYKTEISEWIDLLRGCHEENPLATGDEGLSVISLLKEITR
jgi:predicted dehydrogenase